MVPARRRSAAGATPSRASRRTAHSPTPAGGSPGATLAEWVSLTDLGRFYGISAVHTGKLLQAAGLRQPNGEPSPKAIHTGLCQQQHPGHHHHALWNSRGCGPHLERQGVVPQKQRRLVGLWADLLSALQQGSPSIAVSAEEMAGEIPRDLVQPVNRELRERGCSFQVQEPLRKA